MGGPLTLVAPGWAVTFLFIVVMGILFPSLLKNLMGFFAMKPHEIMILPLGGGVVSFIIGLILLAGEEAYEGRRRPPLYYRWLRRIFLVALATVPVAGGVILVSIMAAMVLVAIVEFNGLSAAAPALILLFLFFLLLGGGFIYWLKEDFIPFFKLLKEGNEKSY